MFAKNATEAQEMLPKNTELFDIIKSKRKDATGKYKFLMQWFVPPVVLVNNLNNAIVAGKTWE